MRFVLDALSGMLLALGVLLISHGVSDDSLWLVGAGAMVLGVFASWATRRPA